MNNDKLLALTGAAAGMAVALLLCVLAYAAADQQGWFGRHQHGLPVQADVYGGDRDRKVRDDVYGGGERIEKSNGANSPSNRLDKLYTPTLSENGLPVELRQ